MHLHHLGSYTQTLNVLNGDITIPFTNQTNPAEILCVPKAGRKQKGSQIAKCCQQDN